MFVFFQYGGGRRDCRIKSRYKLAVKVDRLLLRCVGNIVLMMVCKIENSKYILFSYSEQEISG